MADDAARQSGVKPGSEPPLGEASGESNPPDAGWSDPGDQQATRPAGPHIAGPIQMLRRSTTDRKVAGVCGGLGAYTNIDPLVYRVLFGVFSVFGGFGVLVYGAAWLLIPIQGDDRSEIQRLGRGRGTSSATAWALATTILGFVLFVAIVNDRWTIGIVLIVTAMITFFIIRSRDETAAGRVRSWWSETPPQGPPVPPTTPAPATAATPPAPATAATPPPPPPPASSPPLPAPAPAPPTPPDKQRSLTGWLTLSAAAVVAGILVALDAGDVVSVPTVVVLAAALVVVGAGLIVGTWYGRARSLIFPGTALVIALAAVTAFGSTFRGPIGTLDVEPVSANEIENPYRMSIGDITIDLRRLELRGSTVFIEASAGIGQIEVIYPENVRIQAGTDVGVGEVDAMDAQGVREVGDYVEVRPSAASQGTVRLDLKVGLGNIVFSESAP